MKLAFQAADWAVSTQRTTMRPTILTAAERQSLDEASREMEAKAVREDAATKDGGKAPAKPSSTDDILAASNARVAAMNAYLSDPRRQDGLSLSDRFIAKARELDAGGG